MKQYPAQKICAWSLHMLLKLKGYGGKNLANENLSLTNPSQPFEYVEATTN
jgi:hypothetical protein